MGGHGGLNILPQKRWNVYNWDNRERVRKDEEEAARQQQAQEQQDRERDSKARLDKLRGKRGHQHGGDGGDGDDNGDGDGDGDGDVLVAEESLASHEQLLNLFKEDVQSGSSKRRRLDPMKAAKKVDRTARVVGVEDEKYRLAYGTTSSSRPWYMSMKMNKEEEIEEEARGKGKNVKSSKPKKKSIEELRAERMKREEGERSRARKLMRGVSSTSKHYNSSYGNARP